MDTQISRFAGLRFRELRFPRALEAEFETTTKSARCRRFWWEGLLAISIFVFAICLERWFHPKVFTASGTWEIAAVVFLSLLVNFSMLWQPAEFLREGSIAVAACAIGAAELLIMSNLSPQDSAYAQFGMAAVLIFVNTVMRLRFSYALPASTILILCNMTFLYQDRMLPWGGKMLGLCLTSVTLLLTIMANYSQNREERLNFLLRLRGDQLITSLSRANNDLAIVAEQDALTGVANRYAFDRRLQEVWDKAIAQGSIISLILIDVDHFKRLNDSYGHLYGDKVLKRVAHLISEALRKKEDFVARFGGEEFVVLLPGTPGQLALLVAERLRGLVELAGCPALETTEGWQQGIQATVSCGVVAGSPLEYADLQDYLEQADQALYKAKHNGRNLVCLAGPMKAPALIPVT